LINHLVQGFTDIVRTLLEVAEFSRRLLDCRMEILEVDFKS
jgi:hypothetical protein